jgi:menaquinone-specific isochorismate synthase
VTAAVAAISDGSLEKVVLARDLRGSVAVDFDLRSVVASFSIDYPDCWTYAVDGTFGASPELLVRISHGQVATRVLAGTSPRGHNEESDREQVSQLLASEKNRFEHKLALDSVVESLKPLTSRIDFDESPFAVELPNLIHLASDVHAELSDGSTGLDLVAALHPTAAVAGTPRDRALELIAQLEPFDRGRFASPVGWISSNGDCEWAIALRGGQLSGRNLSAYAGCGVVAESSPASELAESELKLRPMREALG